MSKTRNGTATTTTVNGIHHDSNGDATHDHQPKESIYVRAVRHVCVHPCVSCRLSCVRCLRVRCVVYLCVFVWVCVYARHSVDCLGNLLSALYLLFSKPTGLA